MLQAWSKAVPLQVMLTVMRTFRPSMAVALHNANHAVLVASPR
jgi:hypothetical protein